jgi:hypothetical protein
VNAGSNEIELDGRALATSVWENEGGARASDTLDHQFGRRVMDRSWTIQQLFSGIPARVDGSALTRLSHSAATQAILSLNLPNIKHRKERNARRRFASNALRPASQS